MSRRMGLLGGGGIAASTTLNDNAWDVIRAVSDAGQGENFWSVGDCKEIVLNGTVGKLTLSNFTTYAFIIGFNHNASIEGSGRIHFQLAKTALSGGTDIGLCDKMFGGMATVKGYFSMNSSSTNIGGWGSSQMRSNICGTSLADYAGTIISVIPEALRAVLKTVAKYTNNESGNSTEASAVTATTDFFFLLSEYELLGSCTHANASEADYQEQYAYYSAGNSTIKYKHSDPETAFAWWLRSPSGSNAFINVRAAGTLGRTTANYSYGFAPGFCV